MFRQHTIISFFVCSLLLALSSVAQGQVSVPRFGVIASSALDLPVAAGPLSSGSVSREWQDRSMVLDVGAKYLSQYLRRRPVGISGVLQVNVSGVRCDVRASQGYGRSCYRVTYEMSLEAYLNGSLIWQGTIHRRDVNLTGASVISEGMRLLLVKEGVNELVGALCKGVTRP